MNFDQLKMCVVLVVFIVVFWGGLSLIITGGK